MTSTEDTRKNVLVTAVYAVDTFVNELAQVMPDVKFVYDEQMSFETAIAKLRLKQEIHDIKRDALPLFAFSREVLKYGKDRGKRSAVQHHKVVETNNSITLYKAPYCTLTIPFLYFVETMSRAETFEVAYLADEFKKEFSVTVPVPDATDSTTDWLFSVEYGELESKSINSEGAYYKSIGGTIMISGHYAVYKATKKAITEINAKIYDKMPPLAGNLEVSSHPTLATIGD